MCAAPSPDAGAVTAGRKIPEQDWMRAPATRRVIAALTAGGAEVRFVGGCVRDALAGRPATDVDIATTLAPDKVMDLLARAGIKSVPTGIAHGTVTAVVDHKPFQITTLREDVETFGRHATVAFTDDWTADAARRDFTINALSCAPDGTLFDPFGGAADLAAGRVRFVGDARARIEEDYLRLLRFFRFQAYFGKGEPDPAAVEVAAELAPELGRLSGERIRDELLKLLLADDPVPVLELMIARGVLRQAIPADGDASVVGALLRAEAPDAPPDPITRLAALIPPDPTVARNVAARLRLSNKERSALIALARANAPPGPSAGARWRAVHTLGAPLYRNLLRLAWTRRHGGDDARPGPGLARALAEADDLAARHFPLSGKDVLALGMREGPRLGALLEEVEAWWAEQGFRPSRKECLARLRALIAAG